ncbi:MAG: MYXO-CTERM sorting domain-containing protein [Myxococcales bacterium]|nr:MYXO-CTERM sorting domain-containing protein [Myxococcales bacterium]
MTFRLHTGLGLLTIAGLTLSAPSLAAAATANCMSADGSCEVSNDGFDTVDCMCSDGSGGGGGGGNAWAGLSEMELQPICEAELQAFCGVAPPPDGVPCSSPLGECIIDNDPEDSLSCECANGVGGGFFGGNAWAGLSDVELLAICEMEIPGFCGAPPPPPGLPCSTPDGECVISNEPFDSIECQCSDGSGFGGGGGNMWAGLSEAELLMICEDTVVTECGGGPPPPPVVDCGSRLGTCEISNEPFDSIVCDCADGTDFGGGGGSEWAGLSPEELETVCQEQLELGCGMGETEGTTGETGDETDGTTSGGEETDGTTSGGEETGEGTGTGAETGVSAGETGSEGGSEGTGGEGGAEGDGGGGGGGCSVSTDSTPPGWALALLGLLGLGWRRRRSA